MTFPEPGPIPSWVLVVLLEGVAFSLPSARGAWLSFALLSVGIGLGAAVTGGKRLQALRAGMALVVAVAVWHPVLGGLQLLVAAGWYFGGERQWICGLAVAAGIAAPYWCALVPPLRPTAPVLDLVTWNVSRHPKPGWEFFLVSRFRGQPLDLVVLQEIGWMEIRDGFESWRPIYKRDRAAVGRISESLGLPYVWSDAPLGYRRRPYQSGCVVLSRYPLQTIVGTEPQGPQDPPPAFRIETPIGPVQLSPVHLWSPPLDTLSGRRTALQTLLRRLPGREPQIVLGDTNLLPMDRYDLPDGFGFRDAALVSGRYGGTWPQAFPLARLDAVFVNQGLEVLACEVMAADGSDHRPVFVRLRQRNPLGSPPR